MPNIKNYKLSEICSIFDEAIRSIPGYESYDPQKEVKANIHYDLTHQNVALRLNECMLTKGKKKKSGRLDEFYISKLGKKPRKNAVATSIVLTLPKDYIKEKDFGITEEEYIALEKYYETDAGKNDPEHKYTDHDRILVASAKDKLSKIQFNNEEREKIIKFFEASVVSLEKIFGIKDSDVLYSITHFDESFPHMHMAFLPMQYGDELNQMVHNNNQVGMKERINKKIEEYKSEGIDAQVYEERTNGKIVTYFYGLRHYTPKEDEKPFGCSIKRFKKAQLHTLNKDLEKELKSYGIEANISTGRGKEFDVSKKGKRERQEEIANEIAFSELINMKEKYEKQIEAQADIIVQQNMTIDANELQITNLKKNNRELLEQNQQIHDKVEKLLNENRNLVSINLRLRRKYKKLVEEIKIIIQPILNILVGLNWHLANTKEKKKLAEEINLAYEQLNDTLEGIDNLDMIEHDDNNVERQYEIENAYLYSKKNGYEFGYQKR